MLLGVKAGLGRKIAELPSPWILRHEGATDSADKSLTHFADVRANNRGVLTDRNLKGTCSKAPKAQRGLVPVHIKPALSPTEELRSVTLVCVSTHPLGSVSIRVTKQCSVTKTFVQDKIATA